MGLSPFNTAAAAKAAEQSSMTSRLAYLGGSVNDSLQLRLQRDNDLAEERREAPKRRQTLQDGLAIVPPKRDTGEQSKRNNPWFRFRRRRGDPQPR